MVKRKDSAIQNGNRDVTATVTATSRKVAQTTLEVLDWDEVAHELATRKARSDSPATEQDLSPTPSAASDWSLELDLTGLEAASETSSAQLSAVRPARSSMPALEQVNQLAQQHLTQLLGRKVVVQARAVGAQLPRPRVATQLALASPALALRSGNSSENRDLAQGKAPSVRCERQGGVRELGRIGAIALGNSSSSYNSSADYFGEADHLDFAHHAPHHAKKSLTALSFIPRQRGLTPKTQPQERKIQAQLWGARLDPEAWGMEVPVARTLFAKHQTQLATQEGERAWQAHQGDALQDEVHVLLEPAQYAYAQPTPSQQQQLCAQWLEYLAPQAAQARAAYAQQHGLDEDDIIAASEGDLFRQIPWREALDEYDVELGLAPVAQLRAQVGLPVHDQAPRLRYREMVRLQETHLEYTFQAYNKFRQAWDAPLAQPQHYGLNIAGGIATEYYSSYYFALQQLQVDIYLEYWRLLEQVLEQHQATYQQLIAHGWLMHEKPIIMGEAQLLLAQAGELEPYHYLTLEQAQERFGLHTSKPLPVFEDWSRALTHVVSYRARVQFPSLRWQVTQGWQQLTPNYGEHRILLQPKPSARQDELGRQVQAWTGLPHTHGLRSYSYLLATDVLAQGWRQLASLSELPQTLQCAPAFRLAIETQQLPRLQWQVTRPQHWLAQEHASTAAHGSGLGVDLDSYKGAVYGRAGYNHSPLRLEGELADERARAYWAQAVQNATTDMVFATRKWLAARQRAQLVERQAQLATLCDQLATPAEASSTRVEPAELPNLRLQLGLHEVRTEAVAEYQANQAQLADLELDLAPSWQAGAASLATLRARERQARGTPGLLQRVLEARKPAAVATISCETEPPAQAASSVQSLARYLIGMESWYQEVANCKPLSELLTISTNLSMLEIHTHFTEKIPQQVGLQMTVMQMQDKAMFFTIDDPSKLGNIGDSNYKLDPELQQLLFAPRVVRVRGQQFYDDVLWCNARSRLYPININREFFKTLANSVDLHQLEMSFQTLNYLQGKQAEIALAQVRAREKCYTMYGPRYMAISRYHAAIRYIQYKVTTDPDTKYKLSGNHPRVNQISERELRVGMKFADAVYQAAGNVDARLVQLLLADQEPISEALAADIASGLKHEFERHVLCSIDSELTKVVSQARYTSAVLLAQYQASHRAKQRMQANSNHDFVQLPVPQRMIASHDRYRVPRSLSMDAQQQLPWSFRLLFRLAMSSGYFDQHREVDYYLAHRRELNHLMRTAVPSVQVFQRLQSRNVWQIPGLIIRYVHARTGVRYHQMQLLESRMVPRALTPTGGDVMERARDHLELILPNPQQQRVFVPRLELYMPIPLLSYHLLVARDQVASLAAYKDHLLYTYYHHLRPWYRVTSK